MSYTTCIHNSVVHARSDNVILLDIVLAPYWAMTLKAIILIAVGPVKVVIGLFITRGHDLVVVTGWTATETPGDSWPRLKTTNIKDNFRFVCVKLSLLHKKSLILKGFLG